MRRIFFRVHLNLVIYFLIMKLWHWELYLIKVSLLNFIIILYSKLFIFIDFVWIYQEKFFPKKCQIFFLPLYFMKYSSLPHHGKDYFYLLNLWVIFWQNPNLFFLLLFENSNFLILSIFFYIIIITWSFCFINIGQTSIISNCYRSTKF